MGIIRTYISGILFVSMSMLLIPNIACAEWISMGDINVAQGRDVGAFIEVQSNNTLQYWIGEVDEMEYVKKNGDMLQTGRCKVRITYNSDRSPYSCGQIVVMNAKDLKDANSRAFAVKKCR